MRRPLWICTLTLLLCLFGNVEVMGQAPVANCEASHTAYVAANGVASWVISDIDDSTSVGSPLISPTETTCADVGSVVTVTLTVTVGANSDDCTTDVTILDTLDPVAICQDITVKLDGSGAASISGADVNNTSTDNCASTLTFGVSPNTFSCADTASAVSVTLTVTDGDGSGSSTCTADVTVIDTVAPVATCQAVTVTLDAMGNGTLDPANANSGSNDNCGGTLTFSASTSSFVCGDIGSQMVTLTVADEHMNSSTCMANITIEDVTPPVANCQNPVVQLDGSGIGTLAASAVNNVSTDACGTLAFSLDISSFSCADTAGVVSVELTVDDQNGNTATCMADVTVEDNVAPTALCSNHTLVLDVNGDATLSTADVNNSSVDNCTNGGALTLMLDNVSFNCTNLGANTVTLTVKDVSLNSSTCTSTVTVEDNTAPIGTCQDVTIDLNTDGLHALVEADFSIMGYTDACGTVAIGITPATTLTCANIASPVTVILSVSDGTNSVPCTTSVTAADVTPPVALCNDLTLTLDGSGNASTTIAAIDNGSNDACAIPPTLSINQSTFDCSDAGTVDVVLTVTDGEANASQCTSVVTIVETVPPIALCQDITLILDASGNATATTTAVDFGSTDNCLISNATLTLSQTSFTCTDIGPHNETMIVTDGAGNSDTCATVITVEDQQAPLPSCFAFTVSLDAGGNASISASDINGGGFPDNCVVSYNLSQNTFDCDDIGTVNVTLTGSDPSSNSVSCTSIITVEDNINPSSNCNDITVALNASGTASITVSDLDNASTDNCSIATRTISQNSFTCINIGTNNITLNLTDGVGNASSCVSIVTIEDTIAPVAVCQNVSILLDASGNASINIAMIDAGSNDNCGILMNLNTTAFTCSDVGNNPVILAVTDDGGNVTTCNSTVSVFDTLSPIIVCQNITVSLDASGNVSITDTQIDNGSTDNCSLAGFTLDISNFSCANIGINNIVLTAEDNSGNTKSCLAVVTVEDNLPPVAFCQNLAVVLNSFGQGSITPLMVDFGSSDNCQIVSSTLSNSTFTCANIGANTITLNLVDSVGNSSSCASTVTVSDPTNPIANCQDLTVTLDGNGAGTITTGDADNNSTDNCGIVSYSLSTTSFTCADIGGTSVELTVTDGSGNLANCISQIRIQDITAPNALCQDVTLHLNSNGQAIAFAAAVDNGSTDNCSITSVVLDSTLYDCSDIGSNAVFLTLMDSSGNSATCGANIIVVDTTSPISSCSPRTLALDSNGTASVTVADIDNNSSDNCGIAISSLDVSSFTCSDFGPNSVILTNTDVSGNVSTCTTSVNVQDGLPPTAICQNHTATLDASGSVTLTYTDINNGSFDNCPIDSSSFSIGTFNCSDIGLHNITMTVFDQRGNSDNCTATVTVVDNSPPAVICVPYTAYLNSSGEFTLSVSDVDGGTTDNCSISGTNLSSSSFDCNDIGANIVTYTAVDPSGNSDNCNATVTVVDTLSPNVSCLSLIVNLDSTGNATLNVSDINGGSSDNCSIQSMVLNTSSFSCSDIGNNILTLTVTDQDGNSQSCTSTVTIQDAQSPVAICQDVTLSLNSGGTATLGTVDVDNGSTDNCNISSLSLSNTNFSCTNLGVQSVTMEVLDGSGNVGSCLANITIQDIIPPTVICQNVTKYLNATGTATLVSSEVNNGSFDNCSIVSQSLNILGFTCADLGSNQVTLRIFDNTFNVDSCFSTVTVLDTIAPVANCLNATVYIGGFGNYALTGNDLNNASTDNCSISTFTSSVTNLTCSDLGPASVNLTVTDGSGNSNTCTANITVADSTSPQAICIPYTVVLDASGNGSLTTSNINGASSDNCGIGSTNASATFFDCNDQGPNQVILTVIDNEGNVDTCSSTVTVVDNISPTLTCQSINVILDSNGYVVLDHLPIVTSSADNCGIDSFYFSQDSLDCSNLGATFVLLNAEDQGGNVGNCVVTLLVSDTIGPNAVCNDITISIGAGGNVSTPGSQMGANSTDNCGVTNYTVSNGVFTCSDIGSTHNRLLTVTDGGGNTDTCSANISLIDTLSPTASCLDITVYLDSTGNATIVFADLDGGSSDNCGLASQNLSNTTFGVADIGANQVTMNLTDNSGNSSSCVSNVFVVDSFMVSTDPAINSQVLFNAFPNPTESVLFIEIEAMHWDYNEVATLELVDLSGKVLFTTKVENISQGFQGKIDMSPFASGNYILKLRHRQGERTQKIIKN